MSKKRWTFVIDTEEYSGNFEREMTGFVVGYLPEEAGHGLYEMDQFVKDCGQKQSDKLQEILDSRAVDHGDMVTLEHYSIWPTTGWFNDGKGNHFRVSSKTAKKKTKRYPAYQSVAIYFSKRPTDKQLEFLSDRAFKFEHRKTEHDWDKRPKITCCKPITGGSYDGDVQETVVWTKSPSKQKRKNVP